MVNNQAPRVEERRANCLLSIHELERACRSLDLDCPDGLDEKLSASKKTGINEKETRELEKFCVEQWKEFNLQRINELEIFIGHQKKGGSKFVDIKKQLVKLEEDIRNGEYQLGEYYSMFEEDILGFKEQLEADVSAEKARQRESWLIATVTGLGGAIIGYILGRL